MKSKWNIEALKEYFESKFLEKEKALDAGLISLNERLGLLNELRSGVATKEEIKALEKELHALTTRLDLLSGQDKGVSKFIGWILAAIMIIGFIIQNVKLK
ncbi:MAG: hypothetical protein V4538_15305 [Bacteroidota bacterium]